MSGQTTMYALKPIVSLPRMLDHSKTMYELKNIHEEKRGGDHTGSEIKIVTNVTEQGHAPEYVTLEVRQERILSLLADLKKQISTLCDFLKQTNEADVENPEMQETVAAELIINANPKRQPCSLWILQKLWTDAHFQIQSYAHSSLTVEAPKINTSGEIPPKNTVLALDVKIIWKDVDSLEVTLGLNDYPLQGEVNLLRYISRLTNTYNYEKNSNLREIKKIDTILDLCHKLCLEESSKKVMELLSIIANEMGTEHFINKQKPNIADIALWSVIKQLSLQKLPSTLSKWFDMSKQIF